MRIVVITAQSAIGDSPWWPVLMATPGLERVLLCQRVTHITPGDALRRFRRNVKRHGVLFIPYRIGLLAWSVASRPFRRSEFAAPRREVVPVEELETPDLHSSEVIDRVRAFGADLGLSIGAPILRAPLFRAPRLGTINLHLGKVPEFRGAPPAFWELVQGAPTIGATVHWIDEGLDTGAVIACGEAPIYPTDTLHDVEERATELGVRMLRQALACVVASGGASVPAMEQRLGGSTNRFPTLGQRMKLSRRLAARRWEARLSPRRLVKATAMLVALYVYRPARDLWRTIGRRHPVRVFNFHRVTTLCRDGMTIAPSDFAERARYLARSHDVVTLERAIELVRGGARLSRPVAVITFDDAYRSVHEHARPTLNTLGLPAACFVSTDLPDTERRFAHDESSPVREYLDVMSWSELAELKAQGWSFGTHTATHARLSECTGDVLIREIEGPIAVLRERLGVDAKVLAYPFGAPGDLSTEALDAARRAGQSTVFANFGGENPTGTTAMLLHRFDLGGDHDALGWRCMAHGVDLRRWRSLWPA